MIALNALIINAYFILTSLALFIYVRFSDQGSA